MYNFDPISNLYWTPFIFSFFLILSLKIGDFFKISYKKSFFLYVWHSIFCFIYVWYSLQNGADSLEYYYRATTLNNIEFGFGTNFIVYTTKIFVDFLNFSYIDLFLVHNFIGYLGLLAFASAVNLSVISKSTIIKMLACGAVLLPSVSFWTTALGKDSFSFLSVGLALWASLDIKNRKKLIVFSILIMFMVRPHIGTVMLIAFVLSIVLDKRMSIYSRFFLLLTGVGCTAFLLPVMMKYVGLENVENVEQYVDERQNSNLEGGSSIDISSMSLPEQMFSYIFRPLPFEAHSFFAFISSLDNLYLMFIFGLGMYFVLKKYEQSISSNNIFLLSYFFMTLIVLALTTANLGIAIRQKWMFMPCMIFLIFNLTKSKNKNY